MEYFKLRISPVQDNYYAVKQRGEITSDFLVVKNAKEGFVIENGNVIPLVEELEEISEDIFFDQWIKAIRHFDQYVPDDGLPF